MSRTDDQVDVARILDGDTAAFEGLVRRWQGRLVNLAYRFCRDRGRAEEMAQEAFLRAFRSLGQWRKEAAFSSWLFALAANLYRSELRRNPVQTLALKNVPEPRDSRAADLAYEEARRNWMVRRAVVALPPKYRETFILYYFCELDVAASARSLRVAEGTVKARLSRGREILRKTLSESLVGSSSSRKA